MLNIPVTPDHPRIRLLGRMDRSQSPLALDWTGSGLECAFRGSDLWAELEAPALSPIMWMIVLADGAPVARFPVEPGIRFYPLVLGMEPANTRVITLMKETQCMPDQPEATVLLHSLRMKGDLADLPVRDLKIEFIGDSLTSGEGSLAPRGNDEWITQWFSARGNYSWVACDALNAERRILSQSGWGVCWDWEHNPDHTLTAHYEEIAGVLRGPRRKSAAARSRMTFPPGRRISSASASSPTTAAVWISRAALTGTVIRWCRAAPAFCASSGRTIPKRRSSGSFPLRIAIPSSWRKPRISSAGKAIPPFSSALCRITMRRTWVPASIPTRNGTAKPASSSPIS